MSYDFTTLPNRRTQPSVKWRDMLEKADVPQGIIPFTIADMEFLTAPEIVAGLKQHLDEMVLGYTYANDDFVEAARHWMKTRHGFECSPEQMV